MKFIKRFSLALIALCSLMAAASPAAAQVTTTPTGATITLDSITTEAIVYAPGAVRVIKYKGERPDVKPLKVKGLPKKPEAAERPVQEGHNKIMIDTGKFFVALNTKDGNVSFWSHDDQLILAEQHKTGVIAVDSETGAPVVSQDFQMGRAKVDNLFCPALKAADRQNLMGRKVKVGDKKAGLPKARLDAGKGFEIVWLTGGETTLDALPREGKKNGDITLRSLAPSIDYLFITE